MWGLLPSVGGNITFNQTNNSFSDTQSGSIKNNTRIDITQGHAKRYDVFTSILESSGYEFGSGQKKYTDTIEVNIFDPNSILTTKDGSEINYRNDPDAKEYSSCNN